MAANPDFRNAGLKWTKQQVERLKRLCAGGYEIADIAEALGRSRLSIESKRRMLGLAPANGPRLTDAEKSKIHELLALGLTRGAISRLLKRPRGTIVRYVWESDKVVAKRHSMGCSNGSPPAKRGKKSLRIPARTGAR